MDKTITVFSSAFDHLEPMPPKYTCDGVNVSPPIRWQGMPEGTQSIVLLADDPDAPMGSWVHWVCYDIPAHVRALDEDVPHGETLPGGGQQGVTDFRDVGYGGPCPPSGRHRYCFKLYALDTTLGLPAGKSKREVEKAMAGHVLARGELIGVYARSG